MTNVQTLPRTLRREYSSCNFPSSERANQLASQANTYTWAICKLDTLGFKPTSWTDKHIRTLHFDHGTVVVLAFKRVEGSLVVACVSNVDLIPPQRLRPSHLRSSRAGHGCHGVVRQCDAEALAGLIANRSLLRSTTVN